VVEAAVSLPLLVAAALALLQLALYVHAGHVATAAAQEGARVAAGADRTVAEGVAQARALLEAGLGRSASEVAVRGTDGDDVVIVEVTGRMRTMVPWVGGAALPLEARATASRERFRAGPQPATRRSGGER
jgi:hypothetical protein